MGKTFYIRNVPEETKQYIRRYSAENHLTMADALADLMLLASEHLYLCNGKTEYKKAYEALKARKISSLFGIAKDFKEPFVRDKKVRTFDPPANMTRKLRGYTVVLEKDVGKGFVAYIPKLPGCHTQGETIPDAMENMKEALELYLERKGWDMLAMESLKKIWDNPKDEEMAKWYEKRLKKGELGGPAKSRKREK